MKTILIVIAGMADLPDPVSTKDTPLTAAHIPALDTLAQRGDVWAIPSFDDTHEISHKNALLSILGYDLERGEPSTEELMEYGLDKGASISDFSTLRPFIIPGFSGHGVAVTASAWVRGVAKCTLLRPLDIYAPGSSDTEILETIASQAILALPTNEFVFVYVDYPLKASLKGDYQAKVKALEIIDRHLVAPVADFVWKSDLMINLAITTDLVTPWHRRRPAKLSVPAIFYFNNHDWEGDLNQNFTEVNTMLLDHQMKDPSDLIRYLSNFDVKEDEHSEDLPF